MFGNFCATEVRLATLDEIKKFRPEIFEEIDL